MKSPNVFRAQVFRPRSPRRRRPRRPLPRLRGLPVNRLLPNVITTLALCCGLTAIRFAMNGRFEVAVVAIAAAALFDAMDGRVARMLNAQSAFGAELDSLSDLVSFGVAPALLLYLWTLGDSGGLGWVAALAFAVCCALRLARFNAGLGSNDRPPWAFNYFTGVPAPAGAGLVLLPMIASFATGLSLFAHPALVIPWTLGAAALMVCTVPTFSFKKVRVPQEYALPGLAGVGLVAAALVSLPWSTMSVLGVLYLASIPVSLSRYRRLARAAAAMQSAIEEEPEGETDEPSEACP